MSERPRRQVPGPGQESVWAYPRPPAVVASDEHVQIVLGGVVVADSWSALRVLETSQPPTYYLPRADFLPGSLRPAAGSTTFCEWKGVASYLDLVAAGRVATRAAWFYPEPSDGFAELADRAAVYPGLVDRCTVDGEVAQPQPGDFYGGWITSRVVGPFKGAPGTLHW